MTLQTKNTKITQQWTTGNWVRTVCIIIHVWLYSIVLVVCLPVPKYELSCSCNLTCRGYAHTGSLCCCGVLLLFVCFAVVCSGRTKLLTRVVHFLPPCLLFSYEVQQMRLNCDIHEANGLNRSHTTMRIDEWVTLPMVGEVTVGRC